MTFPPLGAPTEHGADPEPPEDMHDEVARTAAASLHEMAHTMNGLRSQLAEATATISQAVVAGADEVDLGQLFLRAQAFLEEAMSAARPDASPPEPPFSSSEALEQLEQTIEGFNRANAELAAELQGVLGALRPRINLTTR